MTGERLGRSTGCRCQRVNAKSSRRRGIGLFDMRKDLDPRQGRSSQGLLSRSESGVLPQVSAGMSPAIPVGWARILGIVVVAVVSQASVAKGIDSPGALRSAPVPSACQHPAGRLVNGQLPGIAEGQGAVTLSKVTLGQIKPRDGRGAVVSLSCNRGGVGWPNHLVFYDSQMRIVRHFDLYALTRGGRETVRNILIKNRVVTVHVVGILQPGDACEACATGSAQLRFGWSVRKNRIALEQRSIYNERLAAARFVSSIRRSDRTAALRAAPREVVDRIWARFSPDFRKTAGLHRCVGPQSGSSPLGGDETWLPTGAERGCEISFDVGGSQRIPLLGVVMRQATWRTWRIAEIGFGA